MSHELKIFCFVLILCLPEIHLSYAGHDGGHSMKTVGQHLRAVAAQALSK